MQRSYRQLFAGLTLMVLGILGAQTTQAQTLPVQENTVGLDEVVSSAVECVDCVDWSLLGVCFWLKCSWFSCSVRESALVGHYIPEVIIGTYSSYSPFEDLDLYNDVPVAAMSRADSTQDGETNINFKHAEVIGDPALPFFMGMANSDYFCSPAATPFMPYFSSGIDFEWSAPFLERLYPQSWLGLPQINSAISIPILGGHWAPVYPRCGWGAHPLDPINAAVAAQRAAEIVTRNGQPHVYQTVPSDCGTECWQPDPVEANDDSDNKFQMITPVAEDSAQNFGGAATWANGKAKVGQAYGWHLWRYYECCHEKGQWFLGEVRW